jgi:ribulose 1,5-bisphosphate carboxylase large subunit-like protein
MPRELVEAFDNIKDNAKFTQNMYEEREMRFDDFMSEGKKTEEEEGT